MERSYGIGLDIGIASVGWAVVGLNEQAEPCGILRLGTRIFDKAEQPRTGDSLAAPRRMARSMRRQVRRRKLRKEDLYALLAQNGLPGKEEICRAVENGGLEDIYALRTRALDEAVAPLDFSRILLHLMQRRGFKSSRSSAADRESGLLLSAVGENHSRMQENHWRTAGEMLYRDTAFAAHKRNKASEYTSTVSRDMIVQEAELLFDAQRRFGNAWATPELQAEYLTILTRQRSFDEGPGGNSPYGGNLIEARVGVCILERAAGLPRAAKATWSFEYCTLLQKINHLRIETDGCSRPLTDAERRKLIDLCHQSPSLNFERIRKELNLSDDARFNAVHYRDEDVAACERKTKFPVLRNYHTMRKALDSIQKGYIRFVSADRLDAAATALTLYKNDDTLREKLAAAGFEPLEMEALLTIGGFSGFGHISVEACKKLIPHLEAGMNYNEACQAAGYDFQGKGNGARTAFLPAVSEEMDEITSPVVRRAVAQTIKVVNAIIREQGHSPVYLHLELARELSKNFQERNKMDRAMQDNAAENERLMQRLREDYHLVNPGGQDLVKLRLWDEQDGLCAYSLRPIEIERLFEPGYAEVDHIVPYSISFDDRRSNKVLVLTAENRQKGNRLPLQYLQGKRRDDFIVYTKSHVHNYRKRQNLLREALDDPDGKFKQRNLQDTQYIAAFMRTYIENHLAFENHPAAGKKRVAAVNGAVTAYLRKRWGVGKVRADGDLHHAKDAAVIACTTDGMIRRVSRYAARRESEAVLHDKFPEPWPRFADELSQRLSAAPQENLMLLNPAFYTDFDLSSLHPVFVSRMPRRGVTGAAHKETIKGRDPSLGDDYAVVRTPLAKLKLDKDGEIAGYYNPSSDTLLYEALKKRLAAFGGNAEKAFAEPFYKPKSDGTAGACVQKVKTYEKVTSVVPVHGGQAVADNGSMVRVDVYYIPNDGYYWVPIYVADTLKAELPNRAVVHGKPVSEWKPMREEDFLFSLHKNDLVYVESKRPIKFKLQNAGATLEKEYLPQKVFAYFEGGDISTGSIALTTQENAYQSRVGFKTLLRIQKYQVDVLGNLSPVKHETLQRFHLHDPKTR